MAITVTNIDSLQLQLNKFFGVAEQTLEEVEAQERRTREWHNKLYRGFFVHRHKYKGAKRGLGTRGIKHVEQFEPNFRRKPHRCRGK